MTWVVIFAIYFTMLDGKKTASKKTCINSNQFKKKKSNQII